MWQNTTSEYCEKGNSRRGKKSWARTEQSGKDYPIIHTTAYTTYGTTCSCLIEHSFRFMQSSSLSVDRIHGGKRRRRSCLWLLCVQQNSMRSKHVLGVNQRRLLSFVSCAFILFTAADTLYAIVKFQIRMFHSWQSTQAFPHYHTSSLFVVT